MFVWNIFRACLLANRCYVDFPNTAFSLAICSNIIISWCSVLYFPLQFVTVLIPFLHGFLCLWQVQQICINCGVCMGKYFCGTCKLFDDDVCKPVVFGVIFILMKLESLFLLFLYPVLLIHLFFQVSKQQYHCSGCGICRFVIALYVTFFFLFLNKDNLFGFDWWIS